MKGRVGRNWIHVVTHHGRCGQEKQGLLKGSTRKQTRQGGATYLSHTVYALCGSVRCVLCVGVCVSVCICRCVGEEGRREREGSQKKEKEEGE